MATVPAVVLANSMGEARKYIGAYGLNKNRCLVVTPDRWEQLRGLTDVVLHFSASWLHLVPSKIEPVRACLLDMQNRGRVNGVVKECKFIP